MQFYSDSSREPDPHALPDCEVFELTAREVAEREEDLIHDYMNEHRFRLASMNSRVRDQMFDAMIAAEQISGGWFYHFCFPGCLPESDPTGPFETQQAAIDAARNAVQD